MTVSLELLLDSRTEAAVRHEWDSLESAGHSSLGAHRSPSNRPHITVAVDMPEGELDKIDWSLVSLPLEVTLGSTLLFGSGDRRVLARGVIATPALLSVHASIHAQLTRSDPHTRPGVWTPHVTLARRLRLESLPDAVTHVGDPLDGEVIAVRSWNSETRVTRVHLGEPTVRSE